MGAGDVPAAIDPSAAAALLLTTPCGVEAPGEVGTNHTVTGDASCLAPGRSGSPSRIRRQAEI